MEILTVLAAIFKSDALGRLKRWLTFRRMLGIVVFLIVLLCLQQFLLAGFDMTLVFGLDLGLVTEVSALMIVLAVRDHVAMVAHVVRRGLLRLKPVSLLLRRGVRRAFRSRSARPLLPPPPDDEPAGWALAMAKC